jgi:flavin-binding protein dodecin
VTRATAKAGRTAKTPEQAHAEKVARAEETVRKAQARVDEHRQYARAQVEQRGIEGAAIYGPHGGLELHHALTALKSSQTRLANLRAAHPSHAPTPRDEAAKTAASDHQRVEAEHASAVAKREGGAGKAGRTPKTPEAAHAEKVARAEESVRKAQAAHDDALRAYDGAVEGRGGIVGTAGRISSTRTALKSAQTRLANLRAADPSHTPAQHAALKKATQYEAKIAKARGDLAKLEAEYAAHKQQHGLLSEREDVTGRRLLAEIASARRVLADLESERRDDA